MEIAGATAIVTGGASGLGRAAAERLVAGGAFVVLVDLPSSDGQRTADELGSQARFFPGDVLSEDDIRGAIDVASELGPVRIAVNCAGIGPAHRTVGRAGPYPLEQFRRVIEVNLIGTFNVIRLVAERIMTTEPIGGERGVIVNTASIAAFDGQIGQAGYSASKAGIVGLTLPVARDLASQLIRVVTIAPGLFETPMLEPLREMAEASLSSQGAHPSRLGRPKEYGDLVAHIVENPMLNGETIRLDGAIRMGPR